MTGGAHGNADAGAQGGRFPDGGDALASGYQHGDAGNVEGVEVMLQEQVGLLHADLRVGANVAATLPLRANGGNVSVTGVIPYGSGFLCSTDELEKLDPGTPVRPYRNGKDLVDRPRELWIIDTFGLSETQLREQFPVTYQRLLTRVKPERDQNPRATRRDQWWLFGENQPKLRMAVAGLPRFIATTMVAKHRIFQFLDGVVMPDQKLVVVAIPDAYVLGILSSCLHTSWALATGGTLEDRPTYNKSRCFEPFPFPVATPEQTARIRDLAEQLDAHRKRQQAAHASLTLTGMYNVLEKLKSGEALSAKEKAIHEQGLVSVLKTLHDELDAAVLDAYGWGDLAAPLANSALKEAASETLLVRLVALNAERAAEEAQGQIRWLRPEYQHPAGKPIQTAISIDDAGRGKQDEASSDPVPQIAIPRAPWPNALPEQVAAVARVLAASPIPLSEADLAARFTGKGPWKKRLPQIIDTLEALGRVRRDDAGTLTAR